MQNTNESFMIEEMPKTNHQQKLRAIQQQIKVAIECKRKVKIYHGSTNSLRKQSFKENVVVDTSHLNEIIEVDIDNRIAVVEPNVSMEKLLRQTLRDGLMPAIVMEFPSITVGGAIQGGATESGAFKYGGFHDICSEYEVVLGDSSVLIANKSQNSELFRELACCYGTLGIITKVKIKLVPAKKYVKLQYHHVDSFKEACALTLNLCDQDCDYVDGVMFAPDRGVVVTGYLTNDESGSIATFHRFRDEWFYLHAESVVRANELYEEIVPIKDYLFRYDRGAFWMAQYAFKLMRTPFNRFTRFMLSPFCTTRFLYRQLHAADLSQKFVVQDLCIPERNAVSFLEFVDQEIGCYPLWLLPINTRRSSMSTFTPLTGLDEVAINVGVWTQVSDYEKFMAANKKIEAKIRELNGRKTLYAHAYYTEREFWSIYDKATYESLRKKYRADIVFRDVYSKVVVKERYKASISRAILRLPRTKLSKA